MQNCDSFNDFANSTPMGFQHRNEIQFVDRWSLENSNKGDSCTGDIVVFKDKNPTAVMGQDILLSKIEAQAKEIDRLKQLTERQSSKIKSLEAVLKEYLIKPTTGDIILR